MTPATPPTHPAKPARTGRIPCWENALRTPVPIFASRLGTNALEREHRIFGRNILPGEAFFDMAFAAGRELFDTDALALENLNLRDALILPDDATELAVQTLIDAQQDDAASFKIYSQRDPAESAGQAWKLHATGELRIAVKGEQALPEDATILRDYSETLHD